MAKIFPRCKHDMSGVYVSCEGTVLPCCWIGSEPEVKKLKEFYGPRFDQLNIQNSDLDTIMQSEPFLAIEKSWESAKPFSACMKFCGQPLPADLENMQGSNERRLISLK